MQYVQQQFALERIVYVLKVKAVGMLATQCRESLENAGTLECSSITVESCHFIVLSGFTSLHGTFGPGTCPILQKSTRIWRSSELIEA